MGIDPLVLVTGAAGQVGSALRAHLPDARFASRGELDVLDRSGLRSACRGVQVVIHLAALTDVDGCESEPQRAAQINGEGTGNVVAAAHEAGARVIYLSTDYVFDGLKLGEYEESDAPGPISAYGRSKLAGEAKASARPENLIVRTSWVFGGGRNFVSSIVSAAKRDPVVSVVDDQIGRPTSSAALARAIAHLTHAEVTGTVHVAGDGAPCTWADLAEEALAAAGCDSKIERFSTQDYARTSGRVVAPRPANSVLAIDLARRLAVPLEEWRGAVHSYARSLQ